jgi:Cation transporter/ATPase, N-terminus
MTAPARGRLDELGANVLIEGRRRGPLAMFLAQFRDFMILVLLAAAAISGLVGEDQPANRERNDRQTASESGEPAREAWSDLQQLRNRRRCSAFCPRQAYAEARSVQAPQNDLPVAVDFRYHSIAAASRARCV